MIIAPVIDGRLQALDAETGKAVWEARVAYPAGSLHAHDGAAHRQGQGDHRRRAAATGRRAASSTPTMPMTGRRAWRFYTVPGDPSKPFENAAMKKAAATWDGEWWKIGGGGAVWDGMAYDPEAELVYVGTGNAEPWAQQLRTSTRQGQSLRLLHPRGATSTPAS